MTKSDKKFPNDKSGSLFDYLRKKNPELTADYKLAEHIGLWPYLVSKVRNGKQELSPADKYKIAEKSGLTVKRIEALIAGGK